MTSSLSPTFFTADFPARAAQIAALCDMLLLGITLSHPDNRAGVIETVLFFKIKHNLSSIPKLIIKKDPTPGSGLSFIIDAELNHDSKTGEQHRNLNCKTSSGCL